MKPTRPRDLVIIALVAMLAGFGLFAWVYGDLPPLPYNFAASTLVLAVAELLWAPSVKARLAGRPRTKPILPIAVARTAACAKASSVLAALGAGGWLGALVYLLLKLDLKAARADAVVAGVNVLACAVLLAAALRMEAVCRRKDPPPAPA